MTGRDDGGVASWPREASGRGSPRGSGPRRRPAGTGALVLALGALALTPTEASAQSFGPGACAGNCFYADNGNETYYYNGLTVGSISSMEAARTGQLEPTDMTTSLFQSANNDTDVIVYDDNLPNTSWNGLWVCDVLVSGSTTKCNRGRIHLNLRYGVPNRAITCQEQGHAVGLDHSSTTGSCMYQNAAVAATAYDTHDKGHINGYY